MKLVLYNFIPQIKPKTGSQAKKAREELKGFFPHYYYFMLLPLVSTCQQAHQLKRTQSLYSTKASTTSRSRTSKTSSIFSLQPH